MIVAWAVLSACCVDLHKGNLQWTTCVTVGGCMLYWIVDAYMCVGIYPLPPLSPPLPLSLSLSLPLSLPISLSLSLSPSLSLSLSLFLSLFPHTDGFPPSRSDHCHSWWLRYQRGHSWLWYVLHLQKVCAQIFWPGVCRQGKPELHTCTV